MTAPNWVYDPTRGVMVARDRRALDREWAATTGAVLIEDMLAPMKCRGCGHIHDAGHVTVVARYDDCSMWRCPKCNRLLDDRPDVGGTIRLDARTCPPASPDRTPHDDEAPVHP